MAFIIGLKMWFYHARSDVSVNFRTAGRFFLFFLLLNLLGLDRMRLEVSFILSGAACAEVGKNPHISPNVKLFHKYIYQKAFYYFLLQ